MVWSQWRQIWSGTILGGALGVAALLGGERPAQAYDPIPYTIGTSYTTTQTPTTSGSIVGSFLLPCGDVQADQSATDSAIDCVTYDGTSTTLEAGWTFSSGNNPDYVFKSLVLDPSITYTYGVISSTFTSAFYGYDFSEQRYFIFLNDTSRDIGFTLYLNGTVGQFGTSTLPPLDRKSNGFLPYDPATQQGSIICTNPKPPPANELCPGGRSFGINASGTVTNNVPAPFSAVLLLPAAGLLRLRRRYRDQP